MWRTRAVISLLVEDIAGLRMEDTTEGVEAAVLARARRRARLIVAIDLIALVVLFWLRDPARSFLPVGATVETVFTLGVLAVAIHAGFRWAQLDKYRAVARVCAELRERTNH